MYIWQVRVKFALGASFLSLPLKGQEGTILLEAGMVFTEAP